MSNGTPYDFCEVSRLYVNEGHKVASPHRVCDLGSMTGSYLCTSSSYFFCCFMFILMYRQQKMCAECHDNSKVSNVAFHSCWTKVFNLQLFWCLTKHLYFLQEKQILSFLPFAKHICDSALHISCIILACEHQEGKLMGGVGGIFSFYESHLFAWEAKQWDVSLEPWAPSLCCQGVLRQFAELEGVPGGMTIVGITQKRVGLSPHC